MKGHNSSCLGYGRVLSLLILFSLSALGSPQYDISSPQHYLKQCQELKKFMVKNQFKVDCFKEFHHYNADAFETYYKKSKVTERGKVDLAGFNVLHPGSRKTRYKDFSILAQVINQWDLVGTVELLAVISKDLKNNRDLLKSFPDNSSIISKNYRIPGYLIILNELRKIDPSWALLLSPFGEAAKVTDPHELTGFFYRSSAVRPIENEYCAKEVGPRAPHYVFGCFPNFKGQNSIFSRRPFIGSFEAGKFDFTLVTSHVTYNSPSDPRKRREILRKTFNVTHWDDLGVGINSSNYARFAEMKATLQFMNRIRKKYKEKDLIYVGDTNLESEIKFWSEVLGSFAGGEILIESPTSVSDQRFDKNRNPTQGLASNYDHFILSKEESYECQNNDGNLIAKVFNIYEGQIGKKIESKYLVRSKNDNVAPYPYASKNRPKINRIKKNYRNSLEGKMTVKRGKIVPDLKDVDRYVRDMDKRLFQSQKKNNTYYQFFREVVSDHLPIHMACDTYISDDD